MVYCGMNVWDPCIIPNNTCIKAVLRGVSLVFWGAPVALNAAQMCNGQKKLKCEKAHLAHQKHANFIASAQRMHSHPAVFLPLKPKATHLNWKPVAIDDGRSLDCNLQVSTTTFARISIEWPLFMLSCTWGHVAWHIAGKTLLCKKDTFSFGLFHSSNISNSNHELRKFTNIANTQHKSFPIESTLQGSSPNNNKAPK